jgi:hypothetical protein
MRKINHTGITTEEIVEIIHDSVVTRNDTITLPAGPPRFVRCYISGEVPQASDWIDSFT